MKLSIEDDDETIAEEEITFLSSGTKIVTLELDDDLDVNSNFRFIAQGISGFIFKNESILNVESKNCSLFIQTDKSIYKPSDTIKIRVLVLDFNLKPFHLDDDKNLLIYITVKRLIDIFCC